MQATTVLVVDDEPGVREMVRATLAAADHHVLEADSVAAARSLLDHATIDAVVLDHWLPDGTGMHLLSSMNERGDARPVIMLTAEGSITGAVRAMRHGAFHYAEKPIDRRALRKVVAEAVSCDRARRVSRYAPRDEAPAPPATIVGQAPVMREVTSLVERVARSGASTVLVTGESGTGKDLVARAVHALGPRRDRPFLNITCSALPSALLESELFGHERGAFTDASQRKLGLLEQAHGGTVFLDEIGDLEAALQAKLLRFLEDKTFRRVGGVADVQVDVRVVAATHVNLHQAVKQQRFREDLYYRLAVLTIAVPPLREREGDIEVLATYFLERFNRALGRRIRSIEPAALERLNRYAWPGNVRELRNVIERAVLLAPRDSLGPADIDLGAPGACERDEFRLPAGGVDMREVERSLVEQALTRSHGNKTKAARLLGMNRDQIRYRLSRYGYSEDHGS